MLTTFITFYGVFLLGLISPGPDFLLVVKNAALYSRKEGLLTSLGITVANIIHIAYSFIGLGFIISQSIFLFNVIKYAGALYLFYLAYQLLTAKKTVTLNVKNIKQEKKRTSCFWEGFITCLLNPKLALFLVSFFGQMAEVFYGHYFEQFLAGSIIILTVFIYFSSVGLLFQTKFAQGILGKIQNILNKIFGGLLILVGIKIILSD